MMLFIIIHVYMQMSLIPKHHNCHIKYKVPFFAWNANIEICKEMVPYDLWNWWSPESVCIQVQANQSWLLLFKTLSILNGLTADVNTWLSLSYWMDTQADLRPFLVANLVWQIFLTVTRMWHIAQNCIAGCAMTYSTYCWCKRIYVTENRRGVKLAGLLTFECRAWLTKDSYK